MYVSTCEDYSSLYKLKFSNFLYISAFDDKDARRPYKVSIKTTRQAELEPQGEISRAEKADHGSRRDRCESLWDPATVG